MKLEPKKKDQEIESSVADIENLLNSAKSDYVRGAAKKFLAQYIDGDRIVEYCTSIDSWQNGMGSHGYLLKRDKTVVESIILKMN